MSSDHHPESITIYRVTGANDLAQSGFIETYQEVFAGSPYFETYSESGGAG